MLLHFAKVLRELSGVILARGPKLCNFVEWREYKVVYKRCAESSYGFACEKLSSKGFVTELVLWMCCADMLVCISVCVLIKMIMS